MKKHSVGQVLILTFLVIAIGVVPAINAQGVHKTYVIVANGQGPGSTGFAALLGSEVITNMESIGVVIAASDQLGSFTRDSS